MNDGLNDVLIHIGYHKTASTWLQNKLFVSENSVFEPLSLKSKGESTLATDFIFDIEGYPICPFEDNAKRISKAISEVVNFKPSLQSKIPVLSHERLSGNPHSAGFDAKKIATQLKYHFPRAKILILIREQKSFILSNYMQYLAIGGSNSLEKYLTTKYDGKRPYFSPNHINYVPLIQEYQTLFGRENVLVEPFEKFRDQPKSFVKDLECFMKTKINADTIEFGQVVNKKKSPFIMYNFRFLNKLRKKSSVNDYSDLSNRFTRSAINKLWDIASVLLPKQLEKNLRKKLASKISIWVGERYQNSNRELSKVIGKDLSVYGYYPPD